MYDTLRPDLLTATERQRALMSANPTYVVSIDIFRENPFCYLELRRPFILGLAEEKWKATLSHFFVKVCEEKGLLKRLYTQNIDGLDFQIGIEKDKIVNVHGTMGAVACEFCREPFPIAEFRDLVKKNIKDIYKADPTAPKESTKFFCPKCNKPGLKPQTVLYGSALPEDFYHKSDDDFPDSVDLLIIAGTSLTVGPANTLTVRVKSNCPRLLINKEKVGQMLGIKFGKESTRDVFCEGTCDDAFLELAKKLGWVEDLKKYIDKMSPEDRKSVV